MKTTKRLIIAVIAIICCISTANAEFRFGVRAGMNINKIHFNESVANNLFNNGNSCGWNVGAMCDFTVPIIGIGADVSLMYSRMNNGADDEIITTDASTISMKEDHAFGRNFIEIPVNVKYHIPLPAVSRIVSPYIYTGPSFAFKLDKNTIEAMKTKTCQVAWNVGLGVELLKHVQVSASYGFGINNIASNWVTTTNVKAKNNYWTVSAAYLF